MRIEHRSWMIGTGENGVAKLCYVSVTAAFACYFGAFRLRSDLLYSAAVAFKICAGTTVR